VSMFSLRLSESFYQMGAPFVLGLLVAPESVGIFSGADRIVKALGAALQPINQAVLPRMARLRGISRGAESSALFRSATGIILVLASVVCAALLALSTPIVRIVLGEAFAESAGVLRILAPVVLAVGVKTALIFQWFLPNGRDWSVVGIILGSSLLGVAMVISLVPDLQHFGMAWTVLASEAFAAIGLLIAYFILRRHRASNRSAASQAI